MNSAFRKPAFVIIMVGAAATASGFFLRGNTRSDEQAAASSEATANTDERSAIESVAAPEAEKAENKASEIPKPDKATKAPDTPATAPAASVSQSPKTAKERRQLLEILGALTAANYYQTYLNLGLLADGKAKGAYTDKDASKVLDSILSLLDSVDRKLAALAQIDLDKEDRVSLEQMRALSSLLRQQGKELQAFWDSGKDEDATRYESARKDSWAAISKLLGIGR